MVKLKLLNRATGIGKESGKAWARATFGCDHSDGTRSVADFFVTPEIGAKLSGIPLDTNVYVSAELDQNLHFNISDVRSAETTAK